MGCLVHRFIGSVVGSMVGWLVDSWNLFLGRICHYPFVDCPCSSSGLFLSLIYNNIFMFVGNCRALAEREFRGNLPRLDGKPSYRARWDNMMVYAIERTRDASRGDRVDLPATNRMSFNIYQSVNNSNCIFNSCTSVAPTPLVLFVWHLLSSSHPSMEGRASPVSRSVGRHAANVIIPQSSIPFGPVVGGRTDGRTDGCLNGFCGQE